MKKQNVVSKRRPRQNILAMILNSAKQKQKSPGSASTNNTAPTSASRSSVPRKSNKLIASAVELTRRSKATTRRSSVKKKICLMKGSKAFYRGPKGIEKVTVVGVHHDSKLEPYYTIKFRDGKEKQMDGKCLTPIEEEGTISRRRSVTSKYGGSSSEREQPTDQCSSSSSEVEEERFQKGQDAYYRSSEGVTKVKIVKKIGSRKYTVTFSDGSERDVDKDNLVGLIDLTSKELAGLMKEKNEKHSTSQELPATSAPSKNSHDQGYEPETEPSSSENSYEDNIENSPSGGGKKQVFPALPCAVQMVEAKTEDGDTKLVPLYKADMDIYYRSPNGIITVHIVKTHFEDMLEPFYTIRLEDGREKQTDNAHLSLEKQDEDIEGALVVKAEENAEDDEWYQEWKASQLKEDEALRDEIKEYEKESYTASVEESAAQDQNTQAVESIKSPVSQIVQHPARPDHSEHIKEEQSELIESSVSQLDHHPIRIDNSERAEPEPTALVPKHDQSPRGSETDKTGSECVDSLVETPQIKKLDPDDSSTVIQPPQFSVGDDVLYNSSKGDHTRASVIKVRKDEKHRPYFVIKLSSGDEKKVYGHRLTPIRRDPDGSNRKAHGSTRSRSRSVARQDRGRDRNASSLRSTSVKNRSYSRQPSQDSHGSRDTNKRYARRPSIDSHSSRDVSVDRSKASHGRRKTIDRSRSISRLPKEPHQSRGRRAESQDPRGRSHAVEQKETRSRSKSVRTRDNGSREGSEDKQRSRSRSRAPDDSMKRSHVGRKGMVMGVSHRVQEIGGDDIRSTGRSKSSSRWVKVKSSIFKAKQRSFDSK
eukprot:scaffold18488_cov59-Cyclotella_meneghiniana.AAC.8